MSEQDRIADFFLPLVGTYFSFNRLTKPNGDPIFDDKVFVNEEFIELWIEELSAQLRTMQKEVGKTLVVSEVVGHFRLDFIVDYVEETYEGYHYNPPTMEQIYAEVDPVDTGAGVGPPDYYTCMQMPINVHNGYVVMGRKRQPSQKRHCLSLSVSVSLPLCLSLPSIFHP
jgi:hypothetical protein